MRIEGRELRVQGSGFRVQGSGFRLGFRVYGRVSSVQGLGSRVSGLGPRFRIEPVPLGIRVSTRGHRIPLSSEYGTHKTVTARFWPRHTKDSHGQILDVAFRRKALNPVTVLPLRVEAGVSLSGNITPSVKSLR